jgi:antitoxin component of MazEF toxin-antitoxin module
MLSKSIMLHVSKIGVSTYVNNHVCKINSIRKNLKRWTDSKKVMIPDDILEACTVTKGVSVNPETQVKLVEWCLQGRQSDATFYMRQCMMHYHKKHRFTFDAEIMDLLNSDDTTYAVLREVFSVHVEQTETNLHYFQRTLTKRKQKVMNASSSSPSSSNINRIGPFNRYVKDQWINRREELRAICATSKSTDVMKLLSKEWQMNPELKAQYSTKMMVTVE